jgi:RHS repeat-associated protein
MYYPFGEVRWASAEMPTDFGYTGQRLDGMGLMFYHARYYAPSLGRFIQADTIVPEPGNPQSINRYSYVHNNPLRYTDPSGHGLFDKIKKAGKKIIKAGKDWVVDKGKAAASTASGAYNSARDGVRNLVGLDNRIDQSLPQVSFTNPAEAALLSLMGEDKAYLGGDAIDLIRADPAMIAHEQEIVNDITTDPRYMNESFNVHIPNPDDGIIFGGKRTPGNMREQFWGQLKHPTTNRYPATWAVAGNELTWLIRKASVEADVYVSKDGSFIIDYQLTDEFDLRPNRPEGDTYNDVTEILGFLYHDILRGTEMDIEAFWTSIYPQG